VTEDEARKKWCPFARVPDGGGVTGAVTATNRHAGRKTGGDGKPRILRGNAMCIGSECMAWRKAEIIRRVDGGGYALSTYTTRTVGFCGLAGTPQ